MYICAMEADRQTTVILCGAQQKHEWDRLIEAGAQRQANRLETFKIEPVNVKLMQERYQPAPAFQHKSRFIPLTQRARGKGYR